MQAIVEYYTTLPFWELIAVFTALLYVVLAAKENIWCWPAALISTVIYTVIFYDVYLWMDGLLQVYYFAMAIYGWYCWNNVVGKKALAIQQWPMSWHAKAIVLLSALSLLVGWVMANYTPTHFPYIDAATTVFAVFSTYLVAKKVLENWIYWIAIDAVSIYLYIEKQLTPTAVLFVLYVFMAIYGYIQWSKRMNMNDNALERDSIPSSR
ncbi:nicotinamide riboside transporter PnuC [Thalassotalea sp. PP2-459]|uniref:nicotinamide riboside transporter PnuC n=1 Tax=Thalassotalea sp. PP2-459 TaxID=1742724 RepID=UPI0009422528|nr:nicotinamide riboside transporter PnuC [Thalassotalea sp. PP2-459]OKY26740.1 nicotinamide mononucleotide transporter [Thalassotalea sp. PP2-459]